MSVRGQIDRITDEGILFGWCLDESAPGTRLPVTIRIDGTDAGTVLAAAFRQDLRDAGIGDGRHSFTYTLPLAVMRQRRATTISAFRTDTSEAIGESLTWRPDATGGFDDRLTQLENELALMRARLQVTPSSDAAIATLFESVGQFFNRLGQDLREGRPSADGFGLSGHMDLLAATYADIAFPIVATPRCAVLLTASRPAGTLHAVLAEIAASRLATSADIFLLDAGETRDAALLPGIARNLRYLRLSAAPVSSIQQITAALHHELLVFLDGSATPSAAWLDDLVAFLDATPAIGAAGADPAAMPEAGGPLSAIQRQGAATWLRAVDAGAFAVRREALAMAGGFNEAVAGFPGAVVDLCYRLRLHGWPVAAFPAAGPAPPPLAADDPAIRRSQAALARAWPGALVPPNARIAALLTDSADPADLAARAAALRNLGLAPVALAPTDPADPALQAALLGAHLQTVWVPPADAITLLAGLGPALELIWTADPARGAALKAAALPARLHQPG